MTTTKAMMRRLDKVAPPPPEELSDEQSRAISALINALIDLFPSPPVRYDDTLTTCRRMVFDASDYHPDGWGGMLDWLHRCAKGRATAADAALLDRLPADALAAMGMTHTTYAQFMLRIFSHC